jgi:tRNA G46 methylase TrmB
MAGANSVTSNQESLHKDLEEVVRKYARTTFLRPIAEHTREAFAEAEEFVRKFYEDANNTARKADPGTVSGVTSGMCEADPGTESGVTSAETVPVDVILDSGCGTGESTIHIARRFPNNPVIGIDKSFARLNKAGNPVQTAGEDVPRNAFWIRAELLDFWRLALDRVKSGEWTIPYHAVYYPNPWPKQSEATRRFHMHPIFPTLLALGGVTELRTNWEIYAREFAEAAKIVLSECAEAEMTNKQITCESFEPSAPETAFERKYKEAGQKLWRVTVKR